MSLADPAPGKLSCCPNCRTPVQVRAVIDSFDVERNPRYLPRDGMTFCNIFSADVTRALGCEIPHWWRGHELSANDTVSWLDKFGASYDWHEVSGAGAQSTATQGKVAIVIWANPKGHGHVAVVRPPLAPTLPFTPASIRIAQAGRVNHADAPLSLGFGDRPVRFFSHI